MDEAFIQKVKEFVLKEAQKDFGYCGCAECENSIMLNTGKGNVIINIENKK